MRCQPGLRNRKAVKGMASAIADGVVVAVHPHLLDVTVTVTVCHSAIVWGCLGMSLVPPSPVFEATAGGGFTYGWV